MTMKLVSAGDRRLGQRAADVVGTAVPMRLRAPVQALPALVGLEGEHVITHLRPSATMKIERIRIVSPAKTELTTPTPRSCKVPAAPPTCWAASWPAPGVASDAVVVLELAQRLVLLDVSCASAAYWGALEARSSTPLTIGGTRISASRIGTASSAEVGEHDRQSAVHVARQQVHRADIATAMKVASTIQPIGLRSR